MEIDEFVIENMFNHVPAGKTYMGDDYDEYWWREVVDPGEGYLILWADGEHHHTYRRPDELYR